MNLRLVRFFPIAPRKATTQAPSRRPTVVAVAAEPPVRRRPGRPPGGLLLADRATLLAAAERLVRRRGPQVSMDAIAEEAGVTKPTLYREVGDKDALVHALGEQLDGRVRSAIERAVDAVTGRRGQLRTFVRSSLEAVAADRNIYLFVSAGGTGEDRLRQALLLADRTADPLAQRLAEQRVADGADPSVATAWAYGLVGMLHFVTLWWLREPTITADQLADQLTELLWSGLQVDQATTAHLDGEAPAP